MNKLLKNRHILFLLCILSILHSFKSLAQEDIEKIHISSWANSEKQSIKGKYLVLDFWATWCGPCIKSLIETNHLVKVYQDSVMFLAISEEEEKTVKAFLSMRDFNHSFVIDSLGTTFKKFKISGIPEAILINPDGQIVWKGHSSNVNVNLLDQFLRGELNIQQPRNNTIEVITIKKTESNVQLDNKIKFKFEIYDIDTLTKRINTTKFIDNDISVFIRNTSLERSITTLINKNSKFVTFVIPDSILKQKIGIAFESKKHSALEAKKLIIKELEINFNLTIKSKLLNQTMYRINLESNKLKNYSTILNAKSTSNFNQKGSSSGSAMINGKLTFIGIGLTITDLSNSLSNFTKYDFFTDITDETKYDFEIPIDSINDIISTLKIKYGMALTPKIKKNDYFLISVK